MKLPLNNLNYPVKIIIGNSSGSGFMVGHEDQLYLVTAKHVIYRGDELMSDKLKVICHVFSEQSPQNPRIYEIKLSEISQNNNIKFHSQADIAIIKFGTLTENSSKIKFIDGLSIIQDAPGAIVHYSMTGSRKFDEIEITNDVFTLGYPVSLSTPSLSQINYDNPLVRKGIISGKNYQNKTIILDCPVYGGNSGGMVLEVNINGLTTDIHLIGVVVQFVPFIDQWQNIKFPELTNSNYQNSGYSIALPVDYIYELITQIGSV